MPKPCQTRNLLIISNALKQSVHFRTLTLSESGHFHLILLEFSYRILNYHTSVSNNHNGISLEKTQDEFAEIICAKKLKTKKLKYRFFMVHYSILKSAYTHHQLPIS